MSEDTGPTATPEFDRTLKDDPPTGEGIAGALERLPPAADEQQAALHLATPAHEVVGIGVMITGSGIRYRQSRIPVSEDQADIRELAARLAAAGHREGDRYLDLSESADPVTWCKPVVSGEYLRLFGSRLLFGGPEVTAEPDVPPAALFVALRRWLDDDSFRPPAVATLAGDTWLLEGSSATLRLR